MRPIKRPWRRVGTTRAFVVSAANPNELKGRCGLWWREYSFTASIF
jgi:hypothetical protein